MPHYKDGTEAAIGDVVKGKGYNVKDSSGELKEIVGTVVGITPGYSSCNIQVAHVVTAQLESDLQEKIAANYGFAEIKGVTGCGAQGGQAGTPRTVARVGLEYGQCDHFLKIAMLLLTVGLSLLAGSADACDRCGLFGNRCAFKQLHHAQAIVAAPIVYPSINYFVGAPVRVEALVTKAMREDPQWSEFQKFRQWQALTAKPAGPLEPQPATAPPALPSVLTAKCASCHSGATPKKGLLLDGTAPLSAEMALKAMRRVQAGTMPPKDSKVTLSADEAGEVFSALLDLSKPPADTPPAPPMNGGDP